MNKVDNRKFSVYIHTTPDNRVYVGMTSQIPEKRWNDGLGYSKNSAFYEVIKEYGWNNIEHEIVATGLDKETAAALEMELIETYNSTDLSFGFNTTNGGECFSFGSGKPLYCIETDTLYPNAAAAADDIGLKSSATMYNVNAKHKGLTFLQMNEEEVEDYKMWNELEYYPSLAGLSADDLTDEICDLIFGRD